MPSVISFVAANTSTASNANLSTSGDSLVVIDATANVGDVAIIAFGTATNPAAITAPVGGDGASFTYLTPPGGVNFGHSTVLSTYVWYKVITLLDIGFTVHVTPAGTLKSAIFCAVYRGADGTTPIPSYSYKDETSAGLTHATSSLTGAAGSWIASVIFDRAGPASSSWSVSSGQTIRSSFTSQTGGGSVSGAWSDSNAIATGTQGPFTYTGTANTANANSVILQIGLTTAPTTSIGRNFTLLDNVRKTVGINFSPKSNVGANVVLKFQSANTPAVGSGGTSNAACPVVSPNVVMIRYYVTSGTSAITTPVGWTLIGSSSNGTFQLYAAWRLAQVGDSGTVVSGWVDPGAAKWIDFIVAYSTVNATSPFDGTIQFRNESVAGTSHANASITVAGNSWILSAICDRGTDASTAFTVPSTYTMRNQRYTTGGGSVSMAVADSNGVVGAATVTPGAWAGTISTANAIMAELAVQTASSGTSVVGKNFTLLSNVRKVINKSFTILDNVLTYSTLTIRIDDDTNVTDSSQSAAITITHSDDIGMQDSAVVPIAIGQVGVNFTIRSNYRDIAAAVLTIRCNIVNTTQVGVNFTLRSNVAAPTVAVPPDHSWHAIAEPSTSIWKEF